MSRSPTWARSAMGYLAREPITATEMALGMGAGPGDLKVPFYPGRSRIVWLEAHVSYLANSGFSIEMHV